jgi:hypothetical protein
VVSRTDASRNIARLVLEGPKAQGLRRMVMDFDACSERAFLDRQAQRSRVPTLELNTLRSSLPHKPQADTFFVLGSGASVEDLSPEQFAEIRRHRSVGINNWGVHPFVPDLYSFESVPSVGDGQDLPRALSLLNRAEIVAHQPALLVLRPSTHGELAHLSEIPLELRDKVFFYGRVLPATRLRKNLVLDIETFFRFVAPRYPGVVLDSGASVVRMACLGILLGYRKIVFVGVDLNNTQYFWERNPAYLESISAPAPVNNQRDLLHETLLDGRRPFGVLDMVAAIAKRVETALGGSVAVASPGSALTEFLPVYRWEGHTPG